MKVYIKLLGQTEYTDISNYVKTNISIDDTNDDTFDSCSFNAIFNTDFTAFDVTKPFPPKSMIKISTVDNQVDENETNTYWFKSKDCKVARIRKSSTYHKQLYKHEIKCIELIYNTTDYNLPNYTITQPKNEYYDVYSRFAMRQLALNYLFAQNGSSVNIPSGSEVTYNAVNNDLDEIEFGYESNKHFIKLNKSDNESYDINVMLNYAKTASSYFNEFGLFKTDIKVMKGDESFSNQLPLPSSSILFQFNVIRYDASNNILETQIIDNVVNYQGGQVNEVGYQITSFPSSSIVQLNVNVVKKDKVGATPVAYTKVYFNIAENTNLCSVRSLGQQGWVGMETNIVGTTNDTYVKVKLETIQFNVQSSLLNEAVDVVKKTLLQFVEKALHDYNLNRRDKLTLGDDLITLLDIEAKESEWGGYDLKELIYRACKYIGGVPYLTHQNILNVSIPKKQSILLSLNEGQSVEQDILGDEFLDTGMSNVKNLVSSDDFVVERILIGSINPEYSQFADDESAGFVGSNNIYFVKSAKLYTPTLSFTIDGTPITSNISGESHVWDITKRIFEEDIYNALPDARFDFTPEERVSNLSQGNTIKYKSGSNLITRITHQAPRVPKYQPLGYTSDPAEYAIIEMLICLAYETLPSPTENILPSLDFNSIKDFELEIVYCPIIDEISTRYIVDIEERKGVKWEKRMNVSDRLVSYEDIEDVIRTDISQKGNNKIFYSEDYSSFDLSIPTNSIIDNNYYITSKRMTLSKEKTNVEYTLTKDFAFKNEDVGLGTEYERYVIPYEFVQRDIYLENHLIFTRTTTLNFSNDLHGCNYGLLYDMFISNELNGHLYAQFKMEYDNEDDREVLMKLAKLEGKFSMIMTGRFGDNYSAGNQRFNGYNGVSPLDQAEFSQPFRYTDYRGRIKKISELNIGYSEDLTNVSDKRLVVDKDGVKEDYPMFRFPEVSWNDGVNDFEVVKPNKYFTGYDVLLEKDERESIQLNYHTFLESVDEKIKFYSFKTFNVIATLINDIELKDDLNTKGVLDNCEILHDEVITKTLLVQKQWVIDNTITSPYDIDVTDSSISNNATFLSYLNSNYPASEYAVGTKARGTDGVLPALYRYARVEQISSNRYAIETELTTYDKDDFPIGVALFNKTGNNYTLCGIIKDPVWMSGNKKFTFNIYTTRYGKKA